VTEPLTCATMLLHTLCRLIGNMLHYSSYPGDVESGILW